MVRRGKSWRNWPEGLFNGNLGHKAIPHPFHSSAHQMGNAGPSPSKHLLLLWPCFHSLALGRGTEEPVFLIPGGIHPNPISVCCTGVCAAQVSFLLKLTASLPCQLSFSSRSRCWSLQSIKTRKSFAFFIPASFSQQLLPYTPSTPTWISFLGLLYSKVPKTGWLRNILSHSSRSGKSQIKVSHVPSETCRGILLCLFLACSVLSAILDILWLNRHNTLILYFHKVLSVYMGLHSIFPLWMPLTVSKFPHFGLEPTLNNLILTWLNLQRPYFK